VVTDPMIDIALCSGKEIIETEDIVSLFHQSIDEVRAEKARSPRDQNFHSS
jgi:hypothetical protein